MKGNGATSSNQRLYRVDELGRMIRAGGRFFIAGDEKALRRLPRGCWIGGTIPYFMGDSGGLRDSESLFATEVPACAISVEIGIRDAQSLFGVYREAPGNGFTFIVIPAQSQTHLSFALNALRYEDFAARPLVGWVAGVALEEIGDRRPLVFDGRDGRAYADGAAVMHVTLPPGKTAEIGLINIFEPGDGEGLSFAADGFSASEVVVGGGRRDFVQYAREKGLDTRFPLVADRNGAMVNISFQAVDEDAGRVSFYAPVFEGVVYRHARPVGDYVEAFAARVPDGLGARIAYSCNCILNYVHAGLDGRRTAGITGPFTFGEIAYQLLNQTLVYMTIEDTPLAERLRPDVPLRRQYRFLETLVDTIPNPVFYKDLQGRYLGCNKAFEEFSGISKEAIAGRTVRDVLPGERADAEAQADGELLRSAATDAFEHQIEVRDALGRERSLVVRKAVFFDQSGRPAGLVGVLTDVTERLNSERRLSAAYEDLKSAQAQLLQSQKMAAVGRLAGGVAHEINNPLGVILGFAQSACRRLGDGDELEVPLRSIEREALRCSALVKDLLVFSRSSGADGYAPTDVGAAVEASMSLLRPRARLENIDLRLMKDAGLPDVKGNANQIQQVVLNLAGNAMDAMPDGGRIDIRVEPARKRPGWVEVGMTDTGAGIPEELQSRIFEPFFTTKEVGKGTGLGLALVYEIVRKHGGEIEFDSSVGRGTTFTVRLPGLGALRPACAEAGKDGAGR